MPALATPRIFLLGALAIPATSLFLTSYLYNHPLSASKSRTITSTNSLSKSCAASPSLQIINPRNHQTVQDTRSIFLSKQEIGELSDEEILARFTKGFFGGWIFLP